MNLENKLPKEFIDEMKKILTEQELNCYLDSFNSLSQKGIRINLTKIGLEKFLELYDEKDLEKVPYFDNSFYSNKEKFGKDILHQIGCFYSQDPSSMVPVSLLKDYDLSNKLVLDMCASPGGKSLQIASMMGDDGLVVSNEIVPSRAKILQSNIERLGKTNFIVLNDSPKNISQTLQGVFDVVIVDAPCSGEGMFRKDPNAINEWSLEGVKANSIRQKAIIDEADKCLKTGGLLVYSTCTFSPKEDEEVVEYIESKGYSVLPVNEKVKEFTKVSMIKKDTVRCFSGLMRGEGQFCALLKKEKLQETNCSKPKINYVKNKIAEEFIKANLDLDFSYNLEMVKEYICICPKNNLDTKNLKVVSKGVILGQVVKNRLEPHHQLFSALGKYFKVKLDLKDDIVSLKKYLKGEQLSFNLPKGYGCILYNNVPVGGFKSINGDLKNLYPKGLRINLI